jgi:membrane-associated protease RseP (regulator of RpoE activity)
MAACLVAGATATERTAAQPPAKPPLPVVIPFELVLRHIVVPVTVNGSRPLAFVLDTGDQVGIIDLDRARQLALTAGPEIKVGGAGSQVLTGAFIKEATFGLPTLPGFSQPIVLALPLKDLAFRFGHDFDGIIGATFIREFVVEIDYQAQTIALHDKDTFAYSGPGAAIPLKFDSQGHPIADVQVTPIGGTPLDARCVLDIGSGSTLALHTPFVNEHRLPGDAVRTIRALGMGGAGGAVTGRFGRVAELKIGRFVLSRPPTLFAQDTAGAFSSAAIQGNIGAQILSRFRLFLDYARNRIILEPRPGVDAPFDRAISGMSIQTEGNDYRTFRVKDVLEDSPAAAAGVHANDVITSLDGKPAAEWTLSAMLDRLEEVAPCRLTLRRGEETVTAIVTPAKLI